MASLDKARAVGKKRAAQFAARQAAKKRHEARKHMRDHLPAAAKATSRPRPTKADLVKHLPKPPPPSGRDLADRARAKFAPIAKRRTEQAAAKKRTEARQHLREHLPPKPAPSTRPGKAAIVGRLKEVKSAQANARLRDLEKRAGRGRSGSAPGHNKPPGSKRAIGRGHGKPPNLGGPRPGSAGRPPVPPDSGRGIIGPRGRPGSAGLPPKPPDSGRGTIGGGGRPRYRPPEGPGMGIIGGGKPNGRRPPNLEKFPTIRPAVGPVERRPGSGGNVASGGTSPNYGPGGRRKLPSGALPNPRPGNSGSAPGHNKPIGPNRAIGRGAGLKRPPVGPTPAAREGRFSPTGLAPGSAMARAKGRYRSG